jgi:hypothetical protein
VKTAVFMWIARDAYRRRPELANRSDLRAEQRIDGTRFADASAPSQQDSDALFRIEHGVDVFLRENEVVLLGHGEPL